MASENTGYQGIKIIEERYADNNALTGRIMPNIAQISPQAIIPSATNSITFNYPTDVAPTGGIDGNVWYNAGADTLYKKLGGVWTLLIDRVTNDAYIAPVYNTTACPLP